MPKTADEIVVGANGTVRVAPVGTAAPADVTEAWDVAWEDLGYCSEDGVTMSPSQSVEGINVWQELLPVRNLVSERDLVVNFTLRQFAGPQVKIAFGGGTITDVAGDGSTGYVYDPPAPEYIDERALGVEWLDGAETFRLLIPRGMVTEASETQITRTAAADLPIGFSIVGEAGVPAFSMQTDADWSAYADA